MGVNIAYVTPIVIITKLNIPSTDSTIFLFFSFLIGSSSTSSLPIFIILILCINFSIQKNACQFL